MSKPSKDDFDAVRMVIDALTGFEPTDQERIIRWAREKLGLRPSPAADSSKVIRAPAPDLALPGGGAPEVPGETSTDIKTFVQTKAPVTDNQFVAVIAYYFRFQAPEASRKNTINADDVLEACRLTGRQRPNKTAQTLVNAHNQGLLDRGEARGSYAINTVGENLVALTLPAGTGATGSQPARRASRKKGTRKAPVKPVRKAVAKKASKKARR